MSKIPEHKEKKAEKKQEEHEEKHSNKLREKHLFGGSDSGKAAFVLEVLQVFQSNPSLLKVTIQDLSSSLQKLDTKSDSNLFRKQYGNIAQIFSSEEFYGIFKVDGDVLILQTDTSNALNKGLISSQEQKLIQKLHQDKYIYDLNTLRINKKNRCVRCNEDFNELLISKESCTVHSKSFANGKFSCCNKGKGSAGCHKTVHVASLDWSKFDTKKENIAECVVKAHSDNDWVIE